MSFANAQTDVTSTYLDNADFSQGTLATPAICTYAADKGKNNTEYANLVDLDSWTAVDNGDGKAGGPVAIGSGVWIGGSGYTAPATNSDGEVTGNVLGLVACWNASAQYTQNLKQDFPAGTYTIVLAVYNSVGGTNAIDKNLIGFKESGGTEHFATTKQYTVNTWKYEFLTFTLAEETSGYVSLGYKSTNTGSGNMPHLFVSGLEIYEGSVDAEAYAAAKEAIRNAKELAANKERLAGSSYANPSEELLTNGSFNTANQGWTLTNMGYQQNQERPTRYVEKWQSSALTGSGSATQTIKNMPAGAYVFTGYANTNKEENGGALINVGLTSVEVSGSWKEYKIVYNHEEDGDLTVSFTYDNLASNWIAIDEFSLVYGGEYTAYEAAMHKGDWDLAKAAAEAAIANEAYANVTGSEKAALETEIAKAEPTTAVGYDEAAAALNAATATFIAAKDSYDAYVAAKAEATPDLAYATAAKKTAVNDAKAAADASSAEDAATKTTAITIALRAYYESHALAEGVENALNMTDRIANPDAEDGNNGWTWSGNKNNPASNEPWTDADGNSTHTYFDGGNWSGSNWTTTMKQNISLPAGKFLLTAKGRAATNTLLTMAVGDVSVELPHVGNTGNVFGRGWGDGSVEFTTDGSDVEILVTATASPTHEWFSISQFRLVRLELYTEMATATEYEAMANALDAAKAKTLGFAEGEYAPYNNVEAINAIAAAEAIDTDAENAKTDIEAITTALGNWTVNAEEVNAFYDGTFAIQEEHTTGPTALAGWNNPQGIRQLIKNTETYPGLNSATAKAAVFAWGGTAMNYGNVEGYTMPLAAHTIYELTFKTCGWQDGEMGYVSVTVKNSSNEGLGDTHSATATKRITEENPWDEFKVYFETGEAGNYTFGMWTSKHTTFTDLVLKKAVAEDITIDESAMNAPEYNYANVTLTRTLSKDYWNTFSVPFDAEIPDGWTVKEFDSATDNIINFKNAESLVAGVPYLVKPETDVTNPTFDDVIVKATEGETKGDGDYKFAAQIYNKDLATDGSIAYLATDGSVKKLTSGGIKGLRAYFIVPVSGADARIAFIDGDVSTGIENMEIAAQNVENSVYDLQGRRVEAMKKGLYIVNGKKVVK